MNITEKRENLSTLWLYSFSVVNRSVGKLVAVVLFSIFLFLVAMGILVLCFGAAGVLAQLNAMALSKTASVGALVVYLLFTLGSNIYGLFFVTVCWRVLGAQAEEQPMPLSEAFSSSVIPALYQLGGAVVLAVPMMIVVAIVALLRSPALMALMMLAIFFTVGIRLCYSFISMAVANKGPLEGFVCSWNMTKGKGYVDALLMCLMTFGTVLLMELFFVAIGYGAFMLIPTHFAQGFSFAGLSAGWILAAIMLMLIGIFVYFVAITFPVVVFLNRHALASGLSFERDTTFVPLPNLELPDISDNPAHAQQAETTVLLPKEEVQQALQTPQPAVQPVSKKPEVQVTQSSIQTDDTETETLSEHLNQVYTPKPEDIVQYGDEDRMPTILFDDEMAKQLQENQAQFAKRKKEDSADGKKDGPDSIKMSKF